MKNFIFVTLLLTLVASFSHANDYAKTSADGKAAVATVNPYATAIALDVIARGGNAIDAAAAAAFALGVVDGKIRVLAEGFLFSCASPAARLSRLMVERWPRRQRAMTCIGSRARRCRI